MMLSRLEAPPSIHLIPCLQQIKEKLSQGWCKGNFAQDKDGEGTQLHLNNAVKWCIMGARNAVLDTQYSPTIIDNESFNILRKQVSISLAAAIMDRHPDLEFETDSDLIAYNDVECESQEEILQVLEEAIEWAKNQGAST